MVAAPRAELDVAGNRWGRGSGKKKCNQDATHGPNLGNDVEAVLRLSR